MQLGVVVEVAVLANEAVAPVVVWVDPLAGLCVGALLGGELDGLLLLGLGELLDLAGLDLLHGVLHQVGLGLLVDLGGLLGAGFEEGGGLGAGQWGWVEVQW